MRMSLANKPSVAFEHGGRRSMWRKRQKTAAGVGGIRLMVREQSLFFAAIFRNVRPLRGRRNKHIKPLQTLSMDFLCGSAIYKNHKHL